MKQTSLENLSLGFLKYTFSKQGRFHNEGKTV